MTTSILTRGGCAALMLVLFTLAPVSRAHAQVSPVSSLQTSLRAFGMGDASAGVVWCDPDPWGQVASIASVEGVRWSHERTAYDVPLGFRVHIDGDRVLLGHAGVAIGLAGSPVGPGSPVLSASDGPDEFTRGDVSSFQAAVSLGRLLDAHRGRESGSGAWDVALGVARKSQNLSAFGEQLIDGAVTWDVGAQARWSPLRAMPHATSAAARWLRADVGAGAAVLDAFGAPAFGGNFGVTPLVHATRIGGALHLQVRAPEARGAGAGAWLLARLPHLVSATGAYDATSYSSEGLFFGGRAQQGFGGEISLADVVAIRFGRIHASGAPEELRGGWSVGLPLAPWGGIRYDHAHRTYDETDAIKIDRSGWVAWLDVLRIGRDVAATRRAASTHD